MFEAKADAAPSGPGPLRWAPRSAVRDARRDTPTGSGRALRLLNLAERAESRGRWNRAEAWGRAAHAAARDTSCRQRAAFLVGRARLAAGDGVEASHWMHQAWGTGPSERQLVADAELLVGLGLVAVIVSDPELARMRFDAAVTWCASRGYEPTTGPLSWASAYRAFVAALPGGAHDLDAHLERARDPERACRLEALAAVLESRQGELSRAQRRVTQARTTAPSDPIHILLDVAQCSIDLGQARVHGALGEPQRADGMIVEVFERLEALPSCGPGWLGCEVRVLVHLVRHEAERQRDRIAHGQRPFRVHEAGDWFCPPGMDAVDCRRRPVLRRLLAELAARRIREPGRPASASELFAAGWPDQRISMVSAKNRLKVAISTLRKMGFGPTLIGDRDGYRLDPALELELVADPSGPE